ncbi:MAG: DUF4123 domain-containing protein [Parvibaculum sp.]|uniref:DUF4123 domain-containing protein n=1 Tax=Parvibaculum sp. TaxID=2024848 RepID=UPI00329708F7
MSADDIEDYWTNTTLTSGVADTSGGLSQYLDVAVRDLPNSNEDERWITPELKGVLFGHPETGPSLRTYLLVDATLRKAVSKVFDLDMLDVEVRCLFKGEAAEDWKESAPYLIDMTLLDAACDDPSQVPAFQRKFVADHWGHSTGIIIRSSASMEVVWRHFRRFTRVQVEEDMRWSLFRFWDPRVAFPYFIGIRYWEERARQFFTLPSASATLSMIIESGSGGSCTQIGPSEVFGSPQNTAVLPFRLTPDDIALLEGGVRERFIRDVAGQSAELWPHRRQIFETESGWQNEIRRLTQEASDAGLHLDRDIRDYIGITLDKGKPFWSRKDVQAICSRPHLNTGTLRMLAVRNQLETGAIR